jgi:adenine-specific DNA-methyltransferase
LVKRLVLALTNEKYLVFDPFLGVGSTSAAAVKNNRRGMGREIPEEYYDIAVERTKLAMDGKLKTRPMNNPVYDHKNPKFNFKYEFDEDTSQFVLFNQPPSFGAAR